MKNQALHIIIGIIIGVLVSMTAYAIISYQKASNSSVSSSSPNNASDLPLADKGSAVTLTGVIECLPQTAGKSGEQLSICQVGLKTDDGKHYALGSDDPSLVGGQPTGQKVEVSGVLRTTAATGDISGNIHVSSIKKVD